METEIKIIRTKEDFKNELENLIGRTTRQVKDDDIKIIFNDLMQEYARRSGKI